MSFPDDFIIENDNTAVVKPKIIEKVPRVLNLNELIINDNGRKIIITRKEAYISPDKRTDFLKKEDYKLGSAKQLMQEAKKIKLGVASILPIATITAALATPAAPFINAALAASGAVGLGKQADEGTLGLNLETALNTLLTLPLAIKGTNKVIKYADNTARKVFPLYDLYRLTLNIDPKELYYYDLRNLYEKEFVFGPAKYYDKARHQLVTKHPRMAIHLDNNDILNSDAGYASIKRDMNIHPRESSSEVWWNINKPYWINEDWGRIIKIPANKINGKPVGNNFDIFNRVETTGPVSILDAEAMVYNPIHLGYDRVRFTNAMKPNNRGSLVLYQRKPNNSYDTWIKPFQTNLGTIDRKTSTISGTNFGKLIGEGSEQSVYLHPTNPNKVLKVYSDKGQLSLEDLRKFVNLYQTRNNVPFQLNTSFEGFVTDKKGMMYPVFSLLKVNDVLNVNAETWNLKIIPLLNKQMNKVGYTNSHGNYVRGDRKLTDVLPGNITQTGEETFRFIDIFPEGFKNGGKVNKC